ncbi:hypothetical protein EVG20_g8032 [Dentipellis fragilis]|uniref:Uncharacterized protein n=1 Tax=Dentipellis fragilis TaxID=205917 RepID=A0A4Y9YAJ6_9AGAM|nr:hypothetical protein EVG20_g8032 [Dentipellis fragilis]
MVSQRFAFSGRRGSVSSISTTIGHDDCPNTPPSTPTNGSFSSASLKSPLLRAARLVGKLLPLALPKKIRDRSRSRSSSPSSDCTSDDSSDNLLSDSSDSGESSAASVDNLLMLEDVVAEDLATPRVFDFPSQDPSASPDVFAEHLTIPIPQRRSRFSSLASVIPAFNPFSRPTSPDFLDTSAPFSRPTSPLAGLALPLASFLPERDPTEGQEVMEWRRDATQARCEYLIRLAPPVLIRTLDPRIAASSPPASKLVCHLMLFGPRRTVEDVQWEDWEILEDDWWRTSFSAVTVSWTYPQPSPRLSKFRSRCTPPKKHPHYHGTLLRSLKPRPGFDVCCSQCQEFRHTLCPCHFEEGGDGGNVELREDLTGVRGVQEMIEEDEEMEEAAVCSSTKEESEDEEMDTGEEVAALARRVSLLRGDLPPTSLAQDAWQEQANVIFSGILTRLDEDAFRNVLDVGSVSPHDIPSILDIDFGLPAKPNADAHHDVIDLTDSEHSLDSVDSEALPVTPSSKARSLAFASGMEEGGSPSSSNADSPKNVQELIRSLFRSVSPRRLPKLEIPRLPVSPESSSSSPQTLDEIQSLSSNASSARCSSMPPPISLRKDEHGFYVQANDAASDSVMPSFLLSATGRARKPYSRTREIIDGLRSADVPARGRRGAKKSQANKGQGQADTSGSKASALKTPTSTVDSVAQAIRESFQKPGDGWIELNTETSRTRPRNKGPRLPDAFYNPAEAPMDVKETLNAITVATGMPFPPVKKSKTQQKQHCRTNTNTHTHTQTAGQAIADVSRAGPATDAFGGHVDAAPQPPPPPQQNFVFPPPAPHPAPNVNLQSNPYYHPMYPAPGPAYGMMHPSGFMPPFFPYPPHAAPYPMMQAPGFVPPAYPGPPARQAYAAGRG